MISSGDIIFIVPGKRHYSRSLDPDVPCRCLFVHPDAKSIEALLSCTLKSKEQTSFALSFSESRIPPVIHPSEHPAPAATLRALVEACHDGARHLTQMSDLRLALFLLEAQNAFRHIPSAVDPDPPTDQAIAAVAEHLAVRYDQNDSVTALTQLCHLSQSQLRRRFLALYGVSPIAYRNRLRCRIASELLCHTELSVAQISERIGYTDVSDFYRNFKKSYGLAPSLYRARGRSADAPLTKEKDAIPTA